MAIDGKFNTDAKALHRRIRAHDKYGAEDLNEWIFGNLALASGMSILDLGCGTGKQTIPMARTVGNEGAVLSVDLSQEALDLLSKEAVTAGVDGQIATLCCSLDDVHSHLQNRLFDRVLSSYSLYYSHKPEDVIKTIWGVLKREGGFFFCGPSKENNRELKALHYGLREMQIPPETGGAAFMEDTGQRVVRTLFRDVAVVSFENPLRFSSAEALHDYWRSYNLYEEDLEDVFKRAAAEHFKENAVFETRKRVIGVRATK
ncbi:MAG: class I SAM-dependent methyltransferase [Planctomycetes bacterium]|nr:class I SAM-dependent methyltransferase [Planctomycetota bacterium]